MLFVVLALGTDRYAIATERVVEVLPLLRWKTIPGAPRGVAGLMDYRGTLVPVVDLSALALGRAAGSRLSTRVLVTRYPLRPGDERLLALVAEYATDVVRFAPEDFHPSEVQGRSPFLGPVARHGEHLVQRIEVEDLLTDEIRAALYPLNAASGKAGRT